MVNLFQGLTYLYFLESLKNSPAKLDAKNEIESPHPQAYQDPISFLAVQLNLGRTFTRNMPLTPIFLILINTIRQFFQLLR